MESLLIFGQSELFFIYLFLMECIRFTNRMIITNLILINLAKIIKLSFLNHFPSAIIRLSKSFYHKLSNIDPSLRYN